VVWTQYPPVVLTFERGSCELSGRSGVGVSWCHVLQRLQSFLPETLIPHCHSPSMLV